MASSADLSDHSVLVTGGGTGIGKACAARLAADGVAVTICGRTESKLIEAAEVIRAAAGHGGGVPGPYHVQSMDEFVRVLNVNVISTFLSLKYAVPPMVKAGGGSFVAIS